ncbi:DUF4331 domain-containing protein [Tenacibaculum mesophilum]|uniref:DUF4331 domain-containing protein n=1 Tax=Tenacibaculum mesophilum TaxID=104268 RepID=A0AAE9MLQ2_9FLAO|nr:DUF4331 family protein [Tenacibaculum mesophilum]GFD74545.1 hypothetical protein KUL113_39650 [Tenacibaculum sp. KUL113]GFD79315.1 hypothetical protein KUL118_21770 [Tenacibaculum sp. KUL118]GFD92735.1 hypothetical protein KUL154_14680 [Alteromonas sp. KUL154]GFE00754.1 hypothetical protein KUL156_33460 [Alteromonas sp. KUL156]UTD14676.1 DUF4331 domain-containing protein [Tenacibaculum mesophilum]
MKLNNIKILAISILSIFALASCSDDDNNMPPMASIDFSGSYMQKDQMGRPAVNTVFVNSDMKDAFNVTIPSEQGANFAAMFETNLKALSPAYANDGDTNALGLDAAAFAGVLATDVLTVSLDGTTTFYDGTNVLTGRALADDVITVELLLIFGGEDFSENPTLSDDNVDGNDKDFLSSFPYLASPW